MKSAAFSLPMMYADHHVLAVRQLLQALPGVAEIYASSGFHTVEVEFDPTQIDAAQIQAALGEAGYLEELTIPAETGNRSDQPADAPFFRHATAFQQTGPTIRFGQDVPEVQRALWPCPGMTGRSAPKRG